MLNHSLIITEYYRLQGSDNNFISPKFGELIKITIAIKANICRILIFHATTRVRELIKYALLVVPKTDFTGAVFSL